MVRLLGSLRVGVPHEGGERPHGSQEPLAVPAVPELGGHHVVDDPLGRLRRDTRPQPPPELDPDEPAVGHHHDQHPVVVAALSQPHVVEVGGGVPLDVVHAGHDQDGDLHARLPLHLLDEVAEAGPLRVGQEPVQGRGHATTLPWRRHRPTPRPPTLPTPPPLPSPRCPPLPPPRPRTLRTLPRLRSPRCPILRRPTRPTARGRTWARSPGPAFPGTRSGGTSRPGRSPPPARRAPPPARAAPRTGGTGPPARGRRPGLAPQSRGRAQAAGRRPLRARW